ncbi:hypothetical protein V7111_03535 [Neobacillus niacini]|uniref:hypothetical protein n=1 Tax=Neobacillus niacini TaxID=86668 RepID=UPI0030009F6F
MNKEVLFKKLSSSSRGNLFAVEIQKVTEEDEKAIEAWAGELEREGKIKLRECIRREYSVYLHGILKYVP